MRFGDFVNFSSFGLSMVTAEADPFVLLNQHQLTGEKKHFVILNEKFDLYILYPCVIILVFLKIVFIKKFYQLFCGNFLISFRPNINHILL